jgi:hypothetical protein
VATDTGTPDALFERYFWPHYPADVRAAPGGTFRDVDANPGGNPGLPAHLAEAAELFVANAPALLGVPLTFDGTGVARLSVALDRARRDALLAASDPADPQNAFLNAVVHGAAYVGEVIVRAHGGRWAVRRPLWESVVELPRIETSGASGAGDARRHAASAVPPFHWLLKHLADLEIDRGSLAYRFRVHVELATADVAALPRIVASPRALPVLKHPTYDLLVKYLHQHVDTLRDLGAGFPAPAEFTDRAFESLRFEWFHDGRVLAMHGQAPSAGERPSLVEVTWLTAAGFDHADALPADDAPPYFARRRDDATLELTLAWQGRPHTHTLTFRGHR